MREIKDQFHKHVRSVSETSTLDVFYDERSDGKCGDVRGCVDNAVTVPLPAASYFILGGVSPGQGAVITRNRDDAEDVWRLGQRSEKGTESTFYVIETNYDNWMDTDPKDNRRAPAERFLNSTRSGRIRYEHDDALYDKYRSRLICWRASCV